MNHYELGVPLSIQHELSCWHWYVVKWLLSQKDVSKFILYHISFDLIVYFL